MYSLDVYGEEFFRNVEDEGKKHAEWLVPLLVGVFHLRSLVDVGCGTGPLVKAAQDAGLDAWGLEGSAWAVEHSLTHISQIDLRYPFAIFGKQFDLCVSLEVAEHLEREYAGTFVDTLTRLSDTVVLTAAVPGQGGLQHVNEQPREYWAGLFRARGFVPDATDVFYLRRGICAAQSTGHHVAGWFDNIQVYWRVNA